MHFKLKYYWTRRKQDKMHSYFFIVQNDAKISTCDKNSDTGKLIANI